MLSPPLPQEAICQETYCLLPVHGYGLLPVQGYGSATHIQARKPAHSLLVRADNNLGLYSQHIGDTAVALAGEEIFVKLGMAADSGMLVDPELCEK